MKSKFNNNQSNDQLTSKQAMLSFLVPPFGIINYYRKKETSPGAAKASGKIALFSLALTSFTIISKNLFDKKQSLSGVNDKYSGGWISTFITIPDLKIKLKVPSGPKSYQKVFVELKDNKIVVTDENGMIVRF